MPQDLLGSREAARILDVTDETIRRWAEAGIIRHIRLPSGQLRFERADIEAIRQPIEPAEHEETSRTLAALFRLLWAARQKDQPDE